MHFERQKKSCAVNLIAAIMLVSVINIISGFSLMLELGAIAACLLVFSGYCIFEGTEYLLVGSQIEVKRRHHSDILTIGKIKEIQTYDVAYGTAGIITRKANFLNYDGQLVRIKEALKNEEGKSLTEVLVEKYNIQQIQKGR